MKARPSAALDMRNKTNSVHSHSYPRKKVEDVQATLLSLTHALKPALMPLHDALNHTLADNIYPTAETPSFRTARFSGYAIDSTSTAPTRTVIRTPVHPGMNPSKELIVIDKTNAVYVGIGACVPQGADAILPIIARGGSGGGVVNFCNEGKGNIELNFKNTPPHFNPTLIQSSPQPGHLHGGAPGID